MTNNSNSTKHFRIQSKNQHDQSYRLCIQQEGLLKGEITAVQSTTERKPT